MRLCTSTCATCSPRRPWRGSRRRDGDRRCRRRSAECDRPGRHGDRTRRCCRFVDLDEREIAAIVAGVSGGAANVADIYPLAPLQEGILFRHVLSDGGDPYLTPFLMSFDRRGRLELFLGALRELVMRHDILRTAIVWESLSQPVQVVLRDAQFPVEDVPLPESATLDVAQYLRDRFDPRSFRIDVRDAPMLRAYVARDERNDRWLLMLLTHHLILDHTSLDVILHEVALIAADRRDDLPAPTAFRNFVAQARLGIPAAEHEAFFRAMLGDVDEPTAPYGALAVQGDGTGIREFAAALDAAQSTRVRAAARRLGVGPATLFHLAWALVWRTPRIAATSSSARCCSAA